MLQNQYGCKNITAGESSKPLRGWECLRMMEQRVQRTFQCRLKRLAQHCVTALEQHNPASLPSYSLRCQVLAIWITVTLLPDQRKPCPEALICSSTALAHEHTQYLECMTDGCWQSVACAAGPLISGDVSAVMMSRELSESATGFKGTILFFPDLSDGYMLNQSAYEGQRGFMSAWRGGQNTWRYGM